MKRIVDVIATKQHGLYFGNRVLLPFHGYLLKIVIDDHILMDFSPSSKEIHVHETEAFMEIYFKDYKNLHDIISITFMNMVSTHIKTSGTLQEDHICE